MPGYPPPPAPPQPPRRHPSAETALWLGFFALACGPFTGVPAILLARKAERESAAAPHLYFVDVYGPIATITGAFGTFALTALMLAGLAADSVSLAVVWLVLGAALGVTTALGLLHKLPGALAAVGRAFVAQQILTWSFTGAALLGGIWALATHGARVEQAARECATARGAVAEAMKRDDYALARTMLDSVQRACGGENAAASADLAKDVRTRADAFEKAKAAKDAADKAAADAAREQAAVDAFPDVVKRATASLRAAEQLMAQGRWKDASAKRQDASAALAEVRGTKVQASADWIALSDKVDAMGKKLEPQLARVAAAEAAQEKAAARAKEGAMLDSLLSEYKDNEVRADSEFKGRTVTFSGVANTIGKDILDTIYITVGHGWDFELPEVQCMFNDQWARQAARVSKGDRVRLRGHVQGKMMNVLVRDCEFVSDGE